MHMRHKYSEGSVIVLVAVWAEEIFLPVADCRFLHSIVRFPHNFNYSDDDPAGVCNVESI